MNGITKRFEAAIDRVIRFGSHPNHESVRIAALMLCFLAAFFSALGADIDLFTRVAVGRLIVNLGGAPTQDPFAFTTVKPIWFDHELLPGLLFYWASQAFGDAGLFLLKVLFALATILILRRAQSIVSNRRGASFLWLSILAIACTNIWIYTIRAQVITYLCLAIFLFAFVEYRYASRRAVLLLLPIVSWIWVVSHGGFVVGIGFLGIFWFSLFLSDRTRAGALFASLVASCTALFLNPYGAPFLYFIFEAVTAPPSLIPEWHALSLFSGEGVITLFTVTVIVIAALAKKSQIPLEGWLLLAASIVLGIRHQRFIPFFIFTAAVYGQHSFYFMIDWLRQASRDRYLLFQRSLVTTMLIFSVIGGTRLMSALITLPSFTLTLDNYPVKALEWLWNCRDKGNILLHYNDGSYALWRVYPKFKISIDGRYDGVYPMSTLYQSLGALDSTDPSQQKYLREIDPDFIVVNTTRAEWSMRQKVFPTYREVFTADGFAILERTSTDLPHCTSPELPRRHLWQPLF